MPESFNVLVKEIRSLGIDIDLERTEPVARRRTSGEHQGPCESLVDLFKQVQEEEHFDAIKIGLASPDKIRSWSYGEVKSRDDQLPHVQAGTRRPVLREDLRSDQGLRMPLRQVQAPEAPRRHLRKCGVEVTLRRCAASAWATSNWPRRPRTSGS